MAPHAHRPETISPGQIDQIRLPNVEPGDLVEFVEVFIDIANLTAPESQRGQVR
jgi:hypothetical protein